MSEADITPTLQHLRRVVARHCDGGLSDASLLARFASSRDEAAFEVLVWRHGPMVLGVCRRNLRNSHDAEDAMQATFLALARQAGAINKRASVGSWLHRVAYRISAHARRRDRKHGRDATSVEDLPAPLPAESTRREDWPALDEELQQLPEKYRAALVLSYLQGLTNHEVAGQLGCPIGTVFTWLARGRELLRARLIRRGVTLTSSGLTLLVAGRLTAAGLTPGLVQAAIRAATCATDVGISANVIALAEGVLQMSAIKKVQTGIAILLLLGVSALGLFAGIPAGAPKRPALMTAAPPRERIDLAGDPLPDGALVRLGSVRFRHAGLSEYVCLKDRKTVVTAGCDRVLRFWNLASGRQVREVRLQGKAGPGVGGALSADGKMLAALDNGKIVLWEVDSGKEVEMLPGPKGQWSWLDFSPDGKTLVVGDGRTQVTLHDWQNGKQRLLTGFDGRHFSPNVSFSPNSKFLAAGGGPDEALCVYECATGREVRRFRCDALSSTFSLDGKRLVVCSMRNAKGEKKATLRFFDLGTGKEVKDISLGNEGWGRFSPDGKTLVCGSGCLLDCATGRVLHRPPGGVLHQVSFSTDGKTLLSNTFQRLRVWDAATGKERHQDQSGGLGWQPATAISPNGRLLASADWGAREVGVWDLTSGKLLRRLPLKGEKGEDQYARNLMFSADGKTIAAGQWKGFIQWWDSATGKEVRSVQLNDPDRDKEDFVYFFQVRVSPDGKRVSTLEQIHFSQPGRPGMTATPLALWDAVTGKLLAQHRLSGEVRSVAWQADGLALIASAEDGWNRMVIENGIVRWRIAEVAGPRGTASPDDRLFAAQRKQKAGAKAETAGVGVWETATGKEVATLPAGRVDHLALAADNRLLVTTDERFLRVWDLATGKERRRWTLPVQVTDASGNTFVHPFRLTLDGRRAFTALADGTGLMWDLTPARKRAETLVKTAGAKELAGWWTDLASGDARRAYAAVWRLAEVPRETIVPFLRKRLRPAQIDRANLRKHIEQLDSETFVVREKASQRLEELGGKAIPVLREALEKRPPLELRRRLERLLTRAARLPLTPDVLRDLRAMQVLERVASKEGRQLLVALSGGEPAAPQTQQAKAALQRLGDLQER